MFPAACKEAPRVRCSVGHLDDRSGVCERDGGMSGNRHRQGNLCTVGLIYQLRGGENDHVAAVFFHVLRAYDVDGLLLRQDRPLASDTQGYPPAIFLLLARYVPNVAKRSI